MQVAKQVLRTESTEYRNKRLPIMPFSLYNRKGRYNQGCQNLSICPGQEYGRHPLVNIICLQICLTGSIDGAIFSKSPAGQGNKGRGMTMKRDFDQLSLGEIMLRLSPSDNERITGGLHIRSGTQEGFSA